MEPQIQFDAPEHILISTLLPEQFHLYVNQPEQFLLQHVDFTRLWPKTPLTTLVSFLKMFRRIYKDVPYHNLTHAFDVTTTVHAFLQFPLIQQMGLSQEDQSYLLIAAYAHDGGHEGFSNEFYKRSNHQLAITYYFQSPLQNMHAAILGENLRHHGIEVPAEKRQLMINLILMTDNARHSQIMNNFSEREEQFRKGIFEEQVPFLMGILLHMADLSSSLKDTKLMLEWNKRINKEFEMESEETLKMGLIPTLPQMDICKENLSFLSSVLLPIYKSMCAIEPHFEPWRAKLLKNIQYWVEAQPS